MLRVESIHKWYPTRGEDLVVLREVSLVLEPGESAAIMGPSGAGKSTLLNILGTLEPPSSGRFTVGGCDPSTLDAQALARFRNQTVGFVFQDHHLLPQCSVLENVLLPTLAGPRNPEAGSRARGLIERVGLTERMDHRPAELSGGERQRVAIARALINRPSLLLADEPTGNLDGATARTVGELLSELHRTEETMLLVVTHNETLADGFQRRFELIEGRLAPG